MANQTIQQVLNLALQHHQAGRLAQAEQFYRQVLLRQPNQPDALHWLGAVAVQLGRNDAGVDLIGRAVALRPDDAIIHSDLGNALSRVGRWKEALAAYRRAIALKNDFPEVHYNLALLLQNRGQLDEAAAAYRQAIALRPHFAEAYCDLGLVLQEQGRVDEAIAAQRRAIALKGDFARAYSNLGQALMDKGEVDQSLAACRQAIALKGDFPEAHCNLGNALMDKAEVDEAIAAFRRAVALKGDSAPAHSNLGQALLLRGEFPQGWEECEWRWHAKGFPSVRRNFPQPQWNGQPLQGRTLLLHAEQGLGDTVQFARYVPLVAQRPEPGRIVLECPRELLRLFKSLASECQLVERGQPLPAFDLHCPLLSLPLLFATTLENLPCEMPYLCPDPGDVDAWRQRLEKAGDALRENSRPGEQVSSRAQTPAPHVHAGLVAGERLRYVGLVWAGNPRQKNDRNRSMPLACLAPLGSVPNVRFVSLQKLSGDAPAQSPPPSLHLLDLSTDLHDMADTAALIANLDLVISVCTSVAHLAGSLAKPVWTLLCRSADWRWLLDRDDSPWYPTMRLFRQPARGDWDAVVAEVARALAMWAEEERTWNRI